MVSKKPASSKRTKKKQVSAKVVTKKTASKKRAVGKKTVSRKTTKPKVTKAVSKKSPKKSKLTFDEKLATVEAIHRNTSTTLVSPVKPIIEKQPPGTASDTTNRVMIQTARLSGVFFVVAGAFFTLFFAQNLTLGTDIATLSTGVTQTASVCDADDPNYDPNNTDCYTLVTISNDDEVYAAESTPPATFTLDQSAPLHALVNIKIEVEHATEVIVYVYDHLTQTEHRLGNAEQVDTSVWKRGWDTTKYDDGEYKIRTFIKNAGGGYEQFSDYYVVENDFIDAVTENTDTIIATEDTSDTEVTVTDLYINDIAFSMDSPLAGQVTTDVFVDGARKVIIKLLNKKTNTSINLGQAYQETDSRWRFAFDTTVHKNGDYELIAQASNGSGDVDTTRETFKIENSAVIADNTTEEIADAGTDTATTTTTSAAAETNTIDPSVMDPAVTLTIGVAPPLSGTVPIRVNATDVQFVEIYATPKLATVPRFLGLAVAVDQDRWVYRWNTTASPNGEYTLFAKVRNKYGAFTSNQIATAVANETVTTPDTDTDTDTDTTPLSDAFKETQTVTYDVVPEPTPELVSTTTEATSVDPTNGQTIETLLEPYREELRAEFERLAAAYRVGDTLAAAEIETRIASLETAALSEVSTTSETLQTDLQSRIATMLTRVKTDVETTNRIVRERTGDSASTDTDYDGITDYDEVNIFKTDPRMADTDGDGFTDGAEILNGYNPTDATPEALVEFESPKEVGVVREDLLVVQDVTTVAQEEVDTDGVEAEAIISGTALPNSFITLYIFSTPVIVTVKTDADGSWEYRFSKELEDGEHEVYVGITDNSGKIIAKSESFRFVKEVQAFTPVDAATGAPITQTNDESLFSGYMVYLVLSISVVAIGLVLILLGLHLNTRREEESLPVPADIEPAT